MSQSAIGRAALVLTTNATGLRSGLAAETQHARAWADSTATTINARLANIGKGVGKGLTGALSNGKGLALAAGTAVAGIAGVTGAMETLNDVARGGAAAKAFGLTAEQFSGMAGVAKSVGEDQREFIESLVTLGKVASEGAAGKGEVATAWFKSLNLDAQKFKSLRLDEQFFTVFEAIQKIADPAERVRSLMVAFGEDGGKYLLPLLAKSSTEIRAMAGGFAVSATQVAAATKASESFTRAQTAVQQLWRRIMVAAAPVLEFIAGELTRTVGLFSDMESTALPALAKVLKITAQLADTTKAVTAATLIATGVRLKFASAEVGYYAAIAAAKTGIGVVAAAGVGGAAMGLFEASGLGQTFREAGGLLYKTGTTLLADVGGAAKRAEAFVESLERRKGDAAKPAPAPGEKRRAPAEPEPAPPPPPVLKVTDNAALIRGSVAEVTARLKHDFGGKSAADRLLEEQKKGTKLLGDINDGVKSLFGNRVGELLAI